jgi:hypothetical protein
MFVCKRFFKEAIVISGQCVHRLTVMFHATFAQIAISPEEAEELERVQSWVEMMADFEESEGDHLIAMAMKYSDKRRIQDMSKHRS